MTFLNNSARTYSGGVILMCELANITISHSNFINNKALNWGVIVALENVFYANVTVTHSQFFNNSASQGAMSIYVIKESKIQIQYIS